MMVYHHFSHQRKLADFHAATAVEIFECMGEDGHGDCNRDGGLMDGGDGMEIGDCALS